ncbi:histone H1.0-A-like [Convolutriloba macropyga]|uniref:histone H1.0-A-like n=1 Tax=Convolutriloba macropyga TaxID=536237 RepID=UPI003F52838D
MGKGSKRKMEERQAEEQSSKKSKPDKTKDASKESPKPTSKTSPKPPSSSKKTIRDMITEAVTTLHNRAGVSRAAIQKYVKENYDVSENRLTGLIRKNILSMLEEGDIAHASDASVGANGVFRIPRSKLHKKEEKSVSNDTSKSPAAKKSSKQSGPSSPKSGRKSVAMSKATGSKSRKTKH